MGFIIALGIEIIIYVIIYIYFKKQKEIDDIHEIGPCVSAFIIVTVASGLLFNFSPSLGTDFCCISSDYSKTIGSSNLIALQDNNQVEGYSSNTLFLGSGEIDEKMYYYCYIETDDDYQFYKISPEDKDVYIKYCSKDEQPRIEKNCIYEKTTLNKNPKNSFWYCLSFYIKTKDKQIGDIVKDKKKGSGFLDKNISYTIYVPEGSIVQNYNIDMD